MDQSELDTKNKQILVELRSIIKNPVFKEYDILEWSASELEAEDGTVVHYLPKNKVYVKIEQ